MTDPAPDETDLHALSKAELKAWADTQPVPELPEEPQSYFHLDRPGVRFLDLGSLIPRRDPGEDPASVHRAMVFAAVARAGRLPRRESVTVSDRGDGYYIILDGTSTYGAAVRAGWRRLPGVVVDP